MDPNLIGGNMPAPMPVRAIRGAITATENSREAIVEAADLMLRALIEDNDLSASEVIAATFSVTSDLDQVYPAEVARRLGWTEAALMCVQEMQVQGALERCIRVRVLWETDKLQSEVRHRYLRGTSDLRKDLAGN
jgi:chorismate mutase